MPTEVDDSRFRASLAALPAQLTKAMGAAMRRSVTVLKDESQKLAPFKTGALQGNVSTGVEASSGETSGYVQYNVPYAAIQELRLDLKPGPGTRAKSPTPYGTPGPGYLRNPAIGLLKDGTYHEFIKEEVEK